MRLTLKISGFCLLFAAFCAAQTPPTSPATTSANEPALATLPPLSFKLNNASLSETVAALNKALSTDRVIIAQAPDARGVRFSLNGEMTFGQAICALHAQHPLRIQRITGDDKVRRMSLDTSTSKFTLSDAGTAIAQVRVVVRADRLPSGPMPGTINIQPFFDWDIFFDPRLKVKAFTEPRLVEFTDEKGNDAISNTWQATWPPSGDLQEYPVNVPSYSGGSIGWPKAISAVKWTMRVKIVEPAAPGGTVERTIKGEAKNIAVPPPGTPPEPRSNM